MKLNYKKIFRAFCLFLFLLAVGCLKDEIPTIPDITFNSSVELLHYLEEQGDFINTQNCPALVEASEVQANVNQYLLIDVQTSSEYNLGHILNSINVSPGDLIKVLDSIGVQSYKKVVIISRNGQSSAYYASLLRLYGFSNVYSLNFGMAAWHSDFSQNWLDATAFFNRDTLFVAPGGERNELTKLPEIQFSNAAVGARERLNERISTLLNEGFSDSNVETYWENDPSISRDNLLRRFLEQHYGDSLAQGNGDSLEQGNGDSLEHNNTDYIVCYGNRDSYVRIEQVLLIGHLSGTVHYFFPSPADFTSSRHLQTLPVNRTILIYSNDGQLSAFVTAYLRLLGYKASSMLFGLNTFYPDLITALPTLKKYAFQLQPVYNYPYVSGP